MASLQIAFVFANIGMAYYHASRLKKGGVIKHWLWGSLYLLAAGTLAIYFNSWVFFVCSILQRKVIFDTSLSYFRDLPLFYVSKEPDGKSLWDCIRLNISVVDWIHWKLFNSRSEIYIIIYLLLWLLGIVYMLNT